MVSKLIKTSQVFLNKKQNTILSAATVLMVASFISKILGLLRDRLLASAFFGGQEWQLDVYNAAFRIPDMIFQLLVLGALSSAFIPVFSSTLKKNQKQAWQIVSSIISIAIVFFAIFSVIFFIFTKPLNLLIAPSFSTEQIALMSSLSRIMLFSQLFFIISSFLTGVLQSHDRFLIPALTPILYNLGIIIFTFFFADTFGIYAPVFGGVAGSFFHFIIQYPFVKSLGFKFSFNFKTATKPVKKIGRLMLPRTLGLAIEQLELTIAVRLASAMIAGSLSIFYFAQHIFAIPISVFGVTIGQAALPMLSKECDLLGSLDKFKKIFLNSFKNILYLAMPASVLILVLRVPIVRIAIGARDFPWEATLLTARTLSYLSLAIASYSVIQLFVRAFYALEDTRTPLFVGVVAVLLNVFFSVYLTRNLSMDVSGLALANTIAGVFQALCLFFLLNHRVKKFDNAYYLPDVIKMTIASFLMGIALWLPMRLLDRFVLNTARVIDLLILTTVASVSGILVYIFLSYILKVEQQNQFLKLFTRFGPDKKLLSQSQESLSEATTASSTVTPDN